MINNIFQQSNKNEDPLYTIIRDFDNDTKNQINIFWQRYQKIAPKDFKHKLQQKDSFHQRWWEMFLAVGLLNLNINLETNKNDFGPDFSFIYKNKKYYIEAIAPKTGITSQKVPELKEGVFDLPENEFLLRLTAAISEKQKKFKKYLDRGIVQNLDCLIIALSACNLNQFGSLMNYPVNAPLKILKGIGNLSVNIKTRNVRLTKRNEIQKSSGKTVNVNLFNSNDFNIISGLIYSVEDPRNSPNKPESTFTIYKNMKSINKLNLDIFKDLDKDKLFEL